MNDLEMVEMGADKEPTPTAESDKLYQEQLARCTPVAFKLLEILARYQAEGKLKIGENADVKQSLMPVAEEVIAMFLQEDIKWGERKFIVQLALQPIAHLSDIMDNAFSISWDRALANKWGKDAIDLKISDLHNALGGDSLVPEIKS